MPLHELRQAPVGRVLRLLDTFQRRARRQVYWDVGRWISLVVSGLILMCGVLCLVYPEPVPQIAGFMAFWMGCGLAMYRFSLRLMREDRLVVIEERTRRPELLAVLLRRLQRDLPAEGTVSLKLRPEPISTGPGSREGPKSSAGDGTAWTKFDPWLVLETRLADGAHLRLGLVEKRRCRVRERPTPTKPTRTKLQYRDVLHVDVRLRVKARRHPELAALTEAEARRCVRLPDGVTFRRLRVSADQLRLQVRVDRRWCARFPRGMSPHSDGKLAPDEAAFWRARMDRIDASRLVTGLLLSLYQMLHVARFPLPPAAPPPPGPGRAPVAKPERGRKKRRGRRAV
ncbi:hypothetical protein JYK02_20770 [Corallococcus macrosporus]|uniref:DUF3137 domain-containing protein n=1 Tax=Corallococcus macrosporus TaxID=35 RepID=A0ABS3DF64_9BACT|nr:hypothetical protein [Corallococcus macrosporus]MBN8229950.1 hypothetical protein [Corallococcus macrosporus]